MAMRHENFAALILTHGRPDRVITYNSLRAHGYSGRIVIVIDDEDKTAEEYRERFGDEVYQFSKTQVASYTDAATNSGNRKAIIFARNACWEIARELGLTHFIQLDDDYTNFCHQRNQANRFINARYIKDLDAVLDVLLDYYKAIPALTLAMAHGGDFIGGAQCSSRYTAKRKAMNSFICATDRPFKFVGLLNEDVNSYTSLASRGGLFLTHFAVSLHQKMTQANAGGMTDIYLAAGTYVKSFYAVMYQPSSVRINVLGRDDSSRRIHHQVRYRYTMPSIISDRYRKPRASIRSDG